MSLIENVKNQRNDLKSDSATSENPEGKTFIFMILSKMSFFKLRFMLRLTLIYKK